MALLGLAVATGCSSESKEIAVEGHNESVLVVNVQGITDDDQPIKGLTKSASAFSGARLNTNPTAQLVEDEDITAELSFADDNASSKSINLQANATKSGASKAANVQQASNGDPSKAELMDNGVAYQLVILELGANNQSKAIANVAAIAGKPVEIPVVKNKRYKWVAYSYNRAAKDGGPTLPLINDFNNPTLPIGENIDMLHASGDVIVDKVGLKPLGIIFKHKMRRIGVELNLNNLEGDMTAATVTFGGNYFTTGSLDILTGRVSGEQAYAKIPSSSTFVPVADDANNTKRRVAYFYTTKTDGIPNFTVKVTQLRMKDANGTVTEVIGANNPKTYTFDKAFPAGALGKSQRAMIRLTQQASYIEVDGVFWAKTNLYQPWINGKNEYKFLPNNEIYKASDSYFVQNHFEHQTNDPCRMVSPMNTWRMPTKAEYDNLMGNRKRKLVFVKGQHVKVYPNSNDLKREPVIFPFNGTLRGSSVISAAESTMLWTRTKDGNNNNYIISYASNTSGFDSHQRYGYYGNEWLNIRCVRIK